MGAWGKDPWDSDEAADWFGDLWEGTPVVDRVLTALTSGDGEAMQAALWLCTELCRVYVWPIDRYDETLAAAIAAADTLLAGEDDEGLLELWEDDPEIRGRIEAHRAVLVARRDPAAD